MTTSNPAADPFLGEILEQPEALRQSARALQGQVDALARVAALARGASGLVLTGMGSSHDACLSTASVLARRGVRATTVNAAELLHFRLDALGDGAPLVLVSQSGHSVELVRIAEAMAGRAGAPPLITVTNGLDNPLAAAADVAIDTAAGAEVGPSTKTFAACLVALRALVDVLAPEDDGVDVAAVCAAAVADADRAADAAHALLAAPEARAEELARWQDGRASMVILGRGTARAAAEMGALILKEAARRHAESLDTAEFRHGPLELAGPSLAAVVIATEPATQVLDAGLVDELAAVGAATLLIGPEVGEQHPMLAPAVAVIPLQLLAWRLAVEGGRDPGRFQHASKVTTRE